MDGDFVGAEKLLEAMGLEEAKVNSHWRGVTEMCVAVRGFWSGDTKRFAIPGKSGRVTRGWGMGLRMFGYGDTECRIW
eukprot:1572127-Rhodomonas_salina.2